MKDVNIKPVNHPVLGEIKRTATSNGIYIGEPSNPIIQCNLLIKHFKNDVLINDIIPNDTSKTIMATADTYVRLDLVNEKVNPIKVDTSEAFTEITDENPIAELKEGYSSTFDWFYFLRDKITVDQAIELEIINTDNRNEL